MRTATASLVALASAFFTPALAQTYSNCNPVLRSGCPPDSALGKTVNIAFTAASDSFTSQGNPTYGSDGVSFTVAKSGDSPQLTSKWYIMFGKVDIYVKAAPGAGIVSSFVLQSDDLDEIDWEWLGADGGTVQTNYFGKGQTATYDRGAFNPAAGNQADFQKYTIDWTPQQIVWQVNGVTVRTLEPANAKGQYPQTPMQVKFGAWSGGDSANSPGVIQWARGPTDYSKAPFTMKVKSLMVQDYSTGTQYTYGDQSGNWQSIKSNGGSIYSGGNKPAVQSAAQVTAPASGQPIPFTPKETTRTSVYPWIPNPSASQASQATLSNYPGLPSGWTVSDTGKVVPPSSAASTGSAASATQSSVSPSLTPGNTAPSTFTARPSPNRNAGAAPAALSSNTASSSLTNSVLSCLYTCMLGAVLVFW